MLGSYLPKSWVCSEGSAQAGDSLCRGTDGHPFEKSGRHSVCTSLAEGSPGLPAEAVIPAGSPARCISPWGHASVGVFWGGGLSSLPALPTHTQARPIDTQLSGSRPRPCPRHSGQLRLWVMEEAMDGHQCLGLLEGLVWWLTASFWQLQPKFCSVTFGSPFGLSLHSYCSPEHAEMGVSAWATDVQNEK